MFFFFFFFFQMAGYHVAGAFRRIIRCGSEPRPTQATPGFWLWRVVGEWWESGRWRRIWKGVFGLKPWLSAEGDQHSDTGGRFLAPFPRRLAGTGEQGWTKGGSRGGAFWWLQKFLYCEL